MAFAGGPHCFATATRPALLADRPGGKLDAQSETGGDRHFISQRFLDRMLLYSGLSFGMALAVFYLYLLLLSLASGHSVDTNPLEDFCACN